MNRENLKRLGQTIARLRVSRQLQQANLAYEAGISVRTLQRLEAGEIVKSDALIKILSFLGFYEDILRLLSPAAISPSELAKRPNQPQAGANDISQTHPVYRKQRVRTKSENNNDIDNNEGVSWIWPEDQK